MNSLGSDLLIQHQESHISRRLWYLSQECKIFLQTFTLGEGTRALWVLLSFYPTSWVKFWDEAISENISVTDLMFHPIPSSSHSCNPQPEKEEGALEGTLETSLSKAHFTSSPGVGPALAAIWLIFFQGCHICSELLPSKWVPLKWGLRGLLILAPINFRLKMQNTA